MSAPRELEAVERECDDLRKLLAQARATVERWRPDASRSDTPSERRALDEWFALRDRIDEVTAVKQESGGAPHGEPSNTK